MKSILHFLLLLSVSCLLLSCQTTKASVSASEKSEAVATSADRLSSSLMTDSINRWFTLSVDSLFIILSEQGIVIVPEGKASPSLTAESMPLRDAGQGAASLDDMYFLSCKPPATSGQNYSASTKQPTAQRPSALKIYGLHVDAGSNKKSNVHTLTTDSVAESTQSSSVKASDVRKSAPSTAPKYIFYILLLACALYLIYRFRHFFNLPN